MRIEIENFLWKLKMFLSRNFKRQYLDFTGTKIAQSSFFKMIPTNSFAKRKREKVFIIIISILLLITIVYILWYDVKPKIEQKYYGKGFFEGQGSVINTINNAKEIPLVIGQGNNTQVQWINLKEVCEREYGNQN